MNVELISSRTDAVADIKKSFRNYSLVGMLSWQDIRRRYRRSMIGPFWLTISTGVMIATMAIVFGSIFRSPIAEFLPYLATGIILWTFISTTILEGCNAFINADAIIKQLQIPLFVHVLRVVWSNCIILAHNIVIIPLVFLFFLKVPNLNLLFLIPGFLLLAVNLSWIALFLGTICARYRDFPQIISSIIQIFFYITPIIWMPHLVPHRAGTMLINMNPVYHLITIVRAPILGEAPDLLNWAVCILLAFAGWSLTLVFYSKYKHRIPYWL